jgi:hypothetical protein
LCRHLDPLLRDSFRQLFRVRGKGCRIINTCKSDELGALEQWVPARIEEGSRELSTGRGVVDGQNAAVERVGGLEGWRVESVESRVDLEEEGGVSWVKERDAERERQLRLTFGGGGYYSIRLDGTARPGHDVVSDQIKKIRRKSDTLAEDQLRCKKCLTGVKSTSYCDTVLIFEYSLDTFMQVFRVTLRRDRRDRIRTST